MMHWQRGKLSERIFVILFKYLQMKELFFLTCSCRFLQFCLWALKKFCLILSLYFFSKMQKKYNWWSNYVLRGRGIQVLRHHDFDLFWPTHPPYHQTSSFPIPTSMMTSSFPYTHPPINIFFFFLSLINKAKIRQGLFLLKKKLPAA